MNTDICDTGGSHLGESESVSVPLYVAMPVSVYACVYVSLLGH